MIRELTPGTRIYGSVNYTWDGTTESGIEAQPGMYLIQVSTPGHQEFIKVIKE